MMTPSNATAPNCIEMEQIEKTTITGRDMRECQRPKMQTHADRGPQRRAVEDLDDARLDREDAGEYPKPQKKLRVARNALSA